MSGMSVKPALSKERTGDRAKAAEVRVRERARAPALRERKKDLMENTSREM